MESFHFLRPAWFAALVPLLILLAVLWRHRRVGRSWRAVVDPRLLPHLLMEGGGRRGAWGLFAVTLSGLLAITALAGPVWSKLQQPVFRRDSALVVLLDLSRSMDSPDLQPSRLQMAKFKLRDILARRKEGDTALVVFAAEPFTVTPLTNDVDTIDRQLSSLTTELMPVQGSRTDRAISKAQTLLNQSGAVHGDVLLITDGVDNAPSKQLYAAVKKLTSAGYRLSVLGVGTADGAPIPLADGGFVKDTDGAIVLPKLDESALARLAAAGHGIYRHLAADDSDTHALITALNTGWLPQQSQKVAGMKSDQWREAGPWLLLPLLPLAALAFRRGYLLLLCAVILLPAPRNAYAFGWQDLWQRSDQRGAQALAAQQPKQAAELFKDPQWRAAAHYRAGDYQAAIKDLEKQDSAMDDYNRGNALAHLGKYQDALKAYEKALKGNPGFKDAEYNRDLVRKWLQSPQNQPANNAQGQSAQKSQETQDSHKQEKGQEANSAQAKSQEKGSNQAKAQNVGTESDSAAKQQQANNSSRGDRHSAAKDKKAVDNPQDRQNNEERQTAMNDAQAQASDAIKPRSESEQATAQWLRRIPDDPGGLWRRKFLYQYKREYQSQQGEAKPW